MNCKFKSIRPIKYNWMNADIFFTQEVNFNDDLGQVIVADNWVDSTAHLIRILQPVERLASQSWTT